jgi:hypothetical protein
VDFCWFTCVRKNRGQCDSRFPKLGDMYVQEAGQLHYESEVQECTTSIKLTNKRRILGTVQLSQWVGPAAGARLPGSVRLLCMYVALINPCEGHWELISTSGLFLIGSVVFF